MASQVSSTEANKIFFLLDYSDLSEDDDDDEEEDEGDEADDGDDDEVAAAYRKAKADRVKMKKG